MPKNVVRRGPVIDFSKVGKTESLASVAMKIIDVFEAEMSEDQTQWTAVFERVAKLLEQVAQKQTQSFDGSLLKSVSKTEEISQVYADLQDTVIGIRQAVARAIAGENQFKREIEKLKTAEGTWQLRAEQADQENEPELAKKARERMESYSRSILETGEALKNYSEETMFLREKLGQIETILQQSYTAKVILHSREELADSLLTAKNLFKAFNSDVMKAALLEAEGRVAEKEMQAVALDAKSNDLNLTIENVEVLQTLKKLAEEKDAPE